MKKIDLKTLLYRSVLIFLFIVPICASAAPVLGLDTPVKKDVVKPAVIVPNCKVSEIIGFKVDQIVDDGSKEVVNTLSENNEILITISNPKDFLLSRPSDKTELILYADGFPLKGMSTDYFNEISRQYLNDPAKCWPDSMRIPFVFNRDTSNEDAWNSMFKLTKWYKNQNTFEMSLGWSGMFPLQVKASDKPHKVIVIFYKKGSFWGFSILYGLLLLCFVILCKRTGLIRDPDTINDPDHLSPANGPFSLAQTQLAFWTVIVVGGFSYIWLLTGQANSLNTSILLLLGISGGTTGAASFIDYYKKTSLQKSADAQAQAQQAQAQQAQQAQPQQGNMLAAPSVAARAVVPNTVKRHRNFTLDILSDGVNLSVQRTQTALWNLVLGLYFIWYVITNKSMPDFDNTLLVLAGVSSVLYVGSKGPENPQTKPTAVS
jgi:hypothetical protein